MIQFPAYSLKNKSLLWASTAFVAGTIGVSAVAFSANSGVLVKAGELQPHRAIYEMSLDPAGDNNGVSSANGRWVFDMEGGACTGYGLNYRFFTKILFDDGSVREIDASGSSYEDADGLAFNFTNKVSINGDVVEDNQGAASQREQGVLVRLTRPSREEVTLNGNILFPIVQYKQIIAAAMEGNRFLATDVYEGSEDGKAYSPTSAVIGKLRDENAKASGTSDVIKELESEQIASWPVTLTYFDPNQGATGETVPNWQSKFILYENGISRQFSMDYGAFTLSGKLSELKYKKADNCD